jgi:uncharacterized protein YdhG (YjbR/CyaY superfamily)
MKANADVPKDIDSYLRSVPPDARKALQKLRETIRTTAPQAVETISYQIPTYKLNGHLVGFAAFKEHCSFFVMSAAVLKEYHEQIKAYDTSKGTIRFPAAKPLPVALVKKLVKARIKENEEIVAQRAARRSAAR